MPPQSTLVVQVLPPGGGAETWDEEISFIHADDSEEFGSVFVVETDELRRSLIRFGNGVNGRQLPPGAVVQCSYQVGAGLDGNVGADTLTHFDPTFHPLVTGATIRNPLDVTNGRAPEPREEIIRRVPEAYRARQLRAVTLADYVKRAEELPEVSRAAARYAWTGSWRTVQVTERRTAKDFAEVLRWLVEDLHAEAEKVVLVLDNLNTHKLASLYEAFPPEQIC